MKRTCAMLLVTALLLSAAALAACGQQAVTDTPAGTETAAPQGTHSLDALGPAGTPAAHDGTDAQARAAYRRALHDLLIGHTLPDGTPCEPDPNADPDGNQFAILDVDADGREELIIIYTTTYTAGQAQYVLGYDADGGKLTVQLLEYPLLTFYTNGAVVALWSHNQGLGGRFWPYTLYRYDPASDSYAVTGMVDAWDKDVTQTDAEGRAFPDRVDLSGTGIVYYIMESGVYEAVEPVDAAAYGAWRDAHLNGAGPLDIPYQALTSENISKIA